ncbi:glycogen-binding subunit 76A isoform X3 [Chironomus tepperi]|uniref:glycogen-binding subunit 76A isoform X3 n=1 Tax=Chironomus tepperi TaxID=113505 RepID=UPI00391F7F26
MINSRLGDSSSCGLMNTSQSAKNSSQAPPTPAQLNSTILQKYQNHLNQFPPIQHQPLVSSNPKPFDAGKVNATVTHIELENQSNCDITAILNMSCRGRAEAFARSLQSRLRTLGSQEQETDGTDAVDGSSTWVNNNTNSSEITELQPRISSQLNVETADSYFDFDMEPESPGSPIDECEYTRLIETTGSTPQETQAPESGFVCASPCSTLEGESRGSASSSEVQFFDPESSDTGTEFYDCPQVEFQKNRPPRRIYHHLSHNRIAVRPPSPILQSPSSSSSSATPTSKMNGHDAEGEMPMNEIATELAEIPLQENSEERTETEIVNEIVNLEQNGEDEEANIEDDDEREKCTFHNFDVCKTIFVKYDENEDAEENISPPQEDEEIFDQEKILNEIIEIQESKLLEPPDIQIEKEASPEPINEDTDLNEESERKRKDSEESEYERPPRVRRCSSLKTGKTPPGTPGRKKIVRFADVLGLDLADVRTFLDEVPKVPKSAYEDLDVTLPTHAIQLGPPLDKILVPLFQQPGCLPNFLDRLRDGQVCLESAAVTDPINLTITGCVRVRNLDFHKSVHLRYSLDSWRTYSDLTASYVENSCDGFSDKFSFILFGNSMQVGQRVEMAVRFQCKGEQYWDSNYGTNYSFQCLPCNTHKTSPITDNSNSSSSSDVNNTSSTSSEPGSTTSESTAVQVDPLGHRQWSNTFLY